MSGGAMPPELLARFDRGRSLRNQAVGPRRERVSADRAGALAIEAGTIADYRALQRFHYRVGQPGVVRWVLRAMHRAPTVVGRYLGRPAGAELAGVLVCSRPALSCAMRDAATCGRYRGLAPQHAAFMLNREVRTVSRVIIEPRFRGMGVAVRLVRAALDRPEHGMPALRFTEALAAMGRVCPFFERAGMIRYDPRPSRSDLRLLDALNRLGVDGLRIEEVGADDRPWLAAELRRWHKAAHRTPTAILRATSLEELLRAALTHVAARPIYYIHAHTPHIDTL